MSLQLKAPCTVKVTWDLVITDIDRRYTIEQDKNIDRQTFGSLLHGNSDYATSRFVSDVYSCYGEILYFRIFSVTPQEPVQVDPPLLQDLYILQMSPRAAKIPTRNRTALIGFRIGFRTSGLLISMSFKLRPLYFWLLFHTSLTGVETECGFGAIR